LVPKKINSCNLTKTDKKNGLLFDWIGSRFSMAMKEISSSGRLYLCFNKSNLALFPEDKVFSISRFRFLKRFVPLSRKYKIMK